MKHKGKLVRYCPGSAIGTPANMPLNEANRRIELDSYYIKRMYQVGAINTPVVYPHIFGECFYCNGLKSVGVTQ